MGIAGIPWWTTDIGGFSGGNPEDPDFRRLLVRWFQWSTFCPVMRTMFYEFPGDGACWELEDQYMFGSGLLVAPVLEKDVGSRSVYLPAGETWMDIFTQEVYAGGQRITVETPLERIPVFVRKESAEALQIL